MIHLRSCKCTLGKFHIWKVAAWEIVTWEVTLGKRPLGKQLKPELLGCSQRLRLQRGLYGIETVFLILIVLCNCKIPFFQIIEKPISRHFKIEDLTLWIVIFEEFRVVFPVSSFVGISAVVAYYYLYKNVCISRIKV